jgi:2-polyprenyl-3-methyl-5-hydroxy-6-metoxy-1,4-benzoquinol methylase
LYVVRPPGAEEIRQLYLVENYYDLDEWSATRVRNENRRRLALALSHVRAGRMLDIGCAKGSLLDLARDAGLATFGVEISSRNAQIAAQKGHQIFSGSFEEYLATGPEPFDLIACLDVIEHIAAPAPFVRGIASLLALDGLLVMSTPNYSGPVARLLGARDPFMTPPEHLNFFTKGGLTRLLASAGLRIAATETFGTLSDDEIMRGLGKHLPFAARAGRGVAVPALRTSFRVLNALKSGLELEVYARHEDQAMRPLR